MYLPPVLRRLVSPGSCVRAASAISVRPKARWVLLLFSSVSILTRCGGGGGSNPAPPSPPIVSISLAPAELTLFTTASQQFTATVTGSTAGVSWTVNDIPGGNTAVGAINASGLYTAPQIPGSPNIVTIKATAVADSTKSATSRVTVVNPVPQISAISPATVTAGLGDAFVDVQGAGFTPQSVVVAGTVRLGTSFLSSTHLATSVPAQLTAAGKALFLQVTTPGPGGGASTEASFTVINPQPALSALSVQKATVGANGLTLTLTGSNFVPTSIVRWNSADRNTTFISSDQLDASITPADLATATVASVTVFNGAPGGGISNSAAFTVVNTVPGITTLEPPFAIAGGLAMTLTVNGGKFFPGAVVRWNGNDRSTGFVSSTQVTASIAASDLASAGTATVTVVNPSPGGGASDPASFTVYNPLPVIASLEPASAMAGDAAISLTVRGSAFVPGAVVRWNNSDRPTAFVDGTQLTASIPATDLASAALMSVTVANPAPAAGPSALLRFVVNNPAPAITGLSASSAIAGGAGFTLAVNGSGFVSGSIVSWNGTVRTTAFVSNAQVTAAISAADLASAGSAAITVSNPAPGGGNSGTATFTINNPAPVISHLSVNSAAAGDAGFTLSVDGSGFASGAAVRWNGSARTTTFISSAQLTAAISSSDLSAAGIVPVTVLNPAPGGGESNPATFTVNSPLPALSSLSTTTATVGDLAFTLNVTGSNFAPNALVRWNGSDRPTTMISSTSAAATIYAEDLVAAGQFSVSVNNPPPGGGDTASIVFTVNNPAPAVASTSPPSITAGGPAFTLAVTGANFVSESAVQWNGANRATTFVSGAQLTALIPQSDIASPGTPAITVSSPAPGGGTSSPVSFTINSPVPVLSSLSPASHTAGTADFTLTVNGSNFVSGTPGSVVYWNGSSRPTIFLSSTRLTASISAGDLVSAGTASVTVHNPAPNPSASAPVTFTIVAAGTPNVMTFDMYAVNNGARIADAQKLSPGTKLSINDGHDNGTSAPDNGNSIIDGAADRNDMVRLVLSVQPWDTITGTIQLTATDPTLVRVFNEDDQPVTLPETIDRSRFGSGALDYYVEGLAAGNVTFTLTFTQGAPQTSQATVVVGQQTGIRITFDDGPDSTDPATDVNLTRQVIDTLTSSIVGNNLPATFFVQTHVSFRGGNSIGQSMIAAEGAEGSHVEIHTGNGPIPGVDQDHIAHTLRVLDPPYDVTGDGLPDGQNALESDMIQAKARILALTGRTPVLVRPPYSLFNTDVLDTYTRVSLTMQLFDVDSGDTTACATAITIDCMENQLTGTIQQQIASNKPSIVVLFHDIKPMTAGYLQDLLLTIQKAVQSTGRNAHFELFP